MVRRSGKAALWTGLALALLQAAPAGADDDNTVYNGMTRDALKAILAQGGKETSDIAGGPISIKEGPVLVLAQCPQEGHGTCYELEVVRNFSNVKPTTDVVSKWNYTNKVPEASVADNGDLHMEMWLTTVGITGKAVLDTITWFEGAWSTPDALKFWTPYMTPGTGGSTMAPPASSTDEMPGDNPIGPGELATPPKK